MHANQLQLDYARFDDKQRGNAIRTRLRLLFMFTVLTLLSLVIYSVYLSQQQNEHAHQAHKSLFSRFITFENLEDAFIVELSSWKNVLLRGYETGQYHKYLSAYYEAERATNNYITISKQQIAPSSVIAGALKNIQALHSQWGRSAREAIRAYNRAELAPHIAADSITSDIEQQLQQQITVLRDELEVVQKKTFAAIHITNEQKFNQLLLMALLITSAVGLFFFWRLDKDVGKPAAESIKLRNALHQSEARYRSLVETTSDWIWEIDENDRFTYVSPKVKELLGYEPNEVLGRSAFDLMSYDEVQRVKTVYQQLISQKQPFNGMINVNRHKDGQEVILESSGVPLFDSNGKWCGYRGIDRNITARINAEKALQNERDFASQLIETLPTIVLVLDPQGIIDYVNPHFEKITGYSLAETRGKDWFNTFLRPCDVDRIRTVFHTAWDGDKPTRGYINTIVTRDGKELEIEWHDNPIRDQHGDTRQLLAIGQDVTNRRKAEEVERSAKQYLQNILDGMYTFVGLYTPEGIMLEANRAPLEAANIKREDVIGKPFWDTYWWSYSSETQEQVRNALLRAGRGEVVRDDFKVRLSENEFIIIDAMFVPLRDESGSIIQTVGSGVDITDRKRAEDNNRDHARLLDQIFEHTMDNIVVLDKDYNFIRVSHSYARSCHRDIDFFTGKNHFELYPSELRDEVEQHRINKTIYSANKRPFIFPDHPEWGTTYWDLAMIPVLDHDDEIELFLFTLKDVTAQEQTEHALREREARLTEAQAIGHMGNWNWDIKSGALHWSDEIYRIFGLHPQAFKPTYDNFMQRIHPDERELVKVAVNKALYEAQPYSIDHRICLEDDSIRFVHEQGEVRFDENGDALRMIGTVQDITERKMAEFRLMATLAEKDTVLRELHHRVKNNMQVISSLLSLQARYSHTSDPQVALQDSRQRIRAMALIHERLYGSTDLAAVDFLDYLRYLSERMTRLYHDSRFTLKIQVSGEALQLPVDHALPCALICNELITNAIRHAYPDTQQDRLVEIRITDANTERPTIVVRDYGRGIDQDRLTQSSTSLGMVIIKALTRQLNGEIHFESSQGTIARLTFPLQSKPPSANNSIPQLV